MIYGYARASTNIDKQDINRQIRELKFVGCENIFFEYEHGDSVIKEQLQLLLSQIIAGDTIITLEVSRLARSTKQLCELIEIIKDKKVKLQILNSITIDCRNGNIDPMTNAFLQMAGVFSELELKIIRERVKSGVANARAKGKKLGRPKVTQDRLPDKFNKYYIHYINKDINITELAKLTGLSRTSVYKYIKIIKKI